MQPNGKETISPNNPGEMAHSNASALKHHYVIVRADLPHGVQVAQTIHAAGESVKEPVPPNTHAVALHAPSEAHLWALEAELNSIGVSFVAIREPDRNNELMAIGLTPCVRSKQLKKILSKFKLI